MDIRIFLVVDTLILVTLIGGFCYVATVKKRSVAECLVTAFFLSVLGALIGFEVARVNTGLRLFINQVAVNWVGFLFGLLFAGMGIYLMVVTYRDNKPIGWKNLSCLAIPVIFIATGMSLAILGFVS